MEPVTALLVTGLIGGVVKFGSEWIKETGASEERKRQGAYYKEQAKKFEKYAEEAKFDPSKYDKLMTEMDSMFAGLSQSSRNAIMKNAKSQIDSSNKQYQLQMKEMTEALGRRGDKYSDAIAENVKRYSKQVDGLTKQFTRGAAMRRMGASGFVKEGVAKMAEKDSTNRLAMEKQNRKVQEEIAYQIRTGRTGLTERMGLAGERIGAGARHEAAMSDISYSGQRAQAKMGLTRDKFGAEERAGARQRGYREQAGAAEGLGEYMQGIPFQWGGIAQAGLGLAGTAAAGGIVGAMGGLPRGKDAPHLTAKYWQDMLKKIPAGEPEPFAESYLEKYT